MSLFLFPVLFPSLVHCTFLPTYKSGVLTLPVQRYIVNSETPFSAQPTQDRWCNRPYFHCANNSIVKATQVPLTNVYDVMYFGAISLGTPAQTFNVLFETSSGDLCIPSSKSPAAANLGRVYNSSKSSTYIADGRKLNDTHLTGWAISGFTSYENLNINGVPVFEQHFIEVTSLVSPFFNASGIVVDGIMGLAFSLTAATFSVPPFINMMMQGAVAEPVISFYFNANPLSGTNGGQMTLGGIDSTKYVGSITYTDNQLVLGSFYFFWVIRTDSLIVGPYCNGTKLCPNGCSMILDTGSTLILGPTSILSTMATLYGGVYLSNYRRYQVNCNTLTTMPNVTFTIAGTPFTLTPAQYVAIYPLSTGPFCMTNFSPFDLPDPITGQLYWILGDAFLSFFYTIYDFGNNRVGIAQTNQTGPFTPGGKK